MRTFFPRNNKGFSLVELMVVVAIIGILASIAIPSLQKYMAKARQSEAKTSLASLYTAEKAFFAEFNTYSTDFGAIGFQPEGLLRYMTGFTSADDATRLQGFGFTSTAAVTGVFNTSAAGACNAATNPNGPKPCTMTTEGENAAGLAVANSSATLPSTFTAGANSNIYKGTLDAWTIDQNKNVKNITAGVL